MVLCLDYVPQSEESQVQWSGNTTTLPVDVSVNLFVCAGLVTDERPARSVLLLKRLVGPPFRSSDTSINDFGCTAMKSCLDIDGPQKKNPNFIYFCSQFSQEDLRLCAPKGLFLLVCRHKFVKNLSVSNSPLPRQAYENADKTARFLQG